MTKSDSPETTKGSCLCGEVSYVVTGKLRFVCACHCNQCRKTSGHYVAATQCLSKNLEIAGTTLTWYRSSEKAERGFCSACGSNLFWRCIGDDKTSIWAGTIDGPTGLVLEKQIHADQKGDYYELPNVPVISQESLSP